MSRSSRASARCEPTNPAPPVNTARRRIILPPVPPLVQRFVSSPSRPAVRPALTYRVLREPRNRRTVTRWCAMRNPVIPYKPAALLPQTNEDMAPVGTANVHLIPPRSRLDAYPSDASLRPSTHAGEVCRDPLPLEAILACGAHAITARQSAATETSHFVRSAADFAAPSSACCTVRKPCA